MEWIGRDIMVMTKGTERKHSIIQIIMGMIMTFVQITERVCIKKNNLNTSWKDKDMSQIKECHFCTYCKSTINWPLIVTGRNVRLTKNKVKNKLTRLNTFTGTEK